MSLDIFCVLECLMIFSFIRLTQEEAKSTILHLVDLIAWILLAISLDKQNISAYNCKYFLTHNFSMSFWFSKEYPQHMFWWRKKIIFLLRTLN